MLSVSGVVLAAGLGVRMGGPKAELLVDGRRLVDAAVAELRACGLDDVIAVVPPGVDVPGARTVVNPEPSRGMRSSLELGVESVDPSTDAIVVILVDTPGIKARDIGAAVAAWAPGRVVIGDYGDRRTHPVVMSPAMWRAAISVAGPDEGARSYLRTHDDLVDVVALAGDPTDLDTPEDVANWHAF